MIDFACKRFQLTEVIKCGLGLTKADFKLVYYMLDHADEWLTTDDLSESLELSLSTVQRSVKKLYEKSVVLRSQENLDNGGYIFLYKIKPKPALRDLIMKIVHNWVKTVDTELKKW
ncbi:MAG: helix-turn-helix domain-containing protein [Nanoarchaeota archaeon]|nr:helix-turn-helix domain-containing protein [Nanoarchaeota archaeon]